MKTFKEIIRSEEERFKLHPIIHAEVEFIETLDIWEETTRPCDVCRYYFIANVSSFYNFSEKIIPVERIHFINSFNDMKNECIKRGYSDWAIEYISGRIEELKNDWKL